MRRIVGCTLFWHVESPFLSRNTDQISGYPSQMGLEFVPAGLRSVIDRGTFLKVAG